MDRDFDPFAAPVMIDNTADIALTRSASIQLNGRLSLCRLLHALSCAHRILPPSGPTMASRQAIIHTPLGGFVRL